MSQAGSADLPVEQHGSLWNLLRSPHFYLGLGCIVFVVLRETTYAPNAIAWLSGGILAWAILFGAFGSKPLWHWENEKLEDRSENLCTFFDMAHEEIVIVTGCLHHSLFDKPEILDAAKRAIARGVSFKLFHERDFDPKSNGIFRAYLKDNGCEPIRIAPAMLAHGLVVDRKHCKIEKFGAPDDAENKHVDYYAFAPRRARHILSKLKRAIAKAR